MRRALGRLRRAPRSSAPPPCVGCRGAQTGSTTDDEPLPEEPVTAATVLSWREGLVPVPVGEGLVVVDPSTGRSAALNASGALIATLFDGRLDASAVAAALARETGADEAVLLDDVLATAHELRALRLLRHVDPAARSRFDRIVQAGATRVRVSCDEQRAAALLDPLLAALPDALAADHELRVEARRGDWETWADGEQVATATTVDRAVLDLLHQLGDQVRHGSTGTIRLHAGAVELDGDAVLLVGVSDKGKSTLTTALVQRGWGYLTDEIAVVEAASGRVVPYAKALDLDAHARTLLGIASADLVLGARKDKVFPASVGPLGAPGARVRLVVLVDHDASGSTPSPPTCS